MNCFIFSLLRGLSRRCLGAILLLGSTLAVCAAQPTTGSAAIRVFGELQQWHKITVQLAGPEASETGEPNPFTDFRFDVLFTHEAGAPTYRVPGYFAADGNAANTGAKAGNVWRAHFAPDRTGKWNYRVALIRGPLVAANGGGAAVAPFEGLTGSFTVAPSAKTGRDLRGKGWLAYVNRHHLRFAGSGEYFLKAGPDSPETLLAYADFDDTVATKSNAPLKTWAPHVRDWRAGDPTWRNGKGKGLIGALNYVASEGLNTISFLPYNAGGDGDNVWPFVQRDDKLHYDCSKLDQWGIVFDHAQALGLHLHFKLQENEMDDNRLGPERRPENVPPALDGGALGPERKIYLREMIARFGHALALTWNLGEENTQTSQELRDMAEFIRANHYWPSNVVLHTFPHEQDRQYPPLLGNRSALTGVSLQNDWSETHQWTLKWLRESRDAARPWVVANDEQGHWATGVPPDPGYSGFDGTARPVQRAYTLHDVRKLVLWGNLMAGGAGVEYYFGYNLPQQDIDAEDFRSRDQSWDYCRIALEFFQEHRIPFWDMVGADELTHNSIGAESRFCFAQPGELYLLYLSWGSVAPLDLSDAPGEYSVEWFNPRAGGPLAKGSVDRVSGGERVRLGEPPSDPDEDWLILVRRVK